MKYSIKEQILKVLNKWGTKTVITYQYLDDTKKWSNDVLNELETSGVIPKNRHIELNAISNLHALVYLHGTNAPKELIDGINEQLDLLERYMVAIKDQTKNVPMWHDLKANRELYPKNKESK